MDELVLENDYLKLKGSSYNSKSDVSFDVIKKDTNKVIFRMYTMQEDLVDGVFSFEIEKIDNEDELLIAAIKMFINYIFYSFPIHKVEYTTLKSNEWIIRILVSIGFKIEADLKRDSYFDGSYQDKIILGLLKEEYYEQCNC